MNTISENMSRDEHLENLITHYWQALQIKPNRENTYYTLAELYYEYGDLDQAYKTCQQALRTCQISNILCFRTLTKILARLGINESDYPGYLEAFSKYLTMEEAFLSVKHSSKTTERFYNPQSWINIRHTAIKLARDGEFNRAIDYYAETIHREPSLPLPHITIRYQILPQPECLERLFDLYSQIIKLPKIHQLAHVTLGDILTAKNQFSEATQAYKDAWGQAKRRLSTTANLGLERSHIDYMIIGIGKGGTTSLYLYLSKHPEIISPFTKEINFFAAKYNYGLDWYLSQFPPPNFKACKFVTGEVNPWYLSQTHAADRVFNAFPKIKLIAILRNPVARTISHFHMAVRLGKENRTLEQAIEDEIAILYGMENPAAVSKRYWQTEQGYIWFSLYLPFLRKWMSVFPKDQFLILSSEELFKSPTKTLRKIYDFLEISDFKLVNYSNINQGSYSKPSSQIEKVLSDFFFLHNQKLENFLGMEFGWNKR